MQMSELVSAVRGVVNRTDKDTLIATWLNLSVLELARVHDWTDLQSVVTGSCIVDDYGPFSYTTECSSLFRVCHYFSLLGDNRRLLRRYGSREGVQKFPDISELTSGVPSGYVDYGGTFAFVPPPDSTYDWEMGIGVFPTAMTVDADEPSIANIDDLLIYMTAMHISMALGLVEDAGEFRTVVFNDYPGRGVRRGLLQQAIASDKMRPDRVVLLGSGPARSFMSRDEAIASPYVETI